jgi:ribosomal protein S18 acetylase RimI-like enzyme
MQGLLERIERAAVPARGIAEHRRRGGMLYAVTLMQTLEDYYDAAPRPLATTEEVGPFTVFLRTGDGWPYYARPRLGYTGTVRATEVEAVRARQRQLGVPEAVEWVHETTPSLLAAAREAGLQVAECPLLVFPAGAVPAQPVLPAGVRVGVLEADSPDVGAVTAAVSAGFAGSDEPEPSAPGSMPGLMRSGVLAMAGAHDEQGAVGGGSHAPRGAATELTGIAVLPRARCRGVGAAVTAALVADARARGIETILLAAQDDAVARVYERIGFRRVGTACVAEPADG